MYVAVSKREFCRLWLGLLIALLPNISQAGPWDRICGFVSGLVQDEIRDASPEEVEARQRFLATFLAAQPTAARRLTEAERMKGALEIIHETLNRERRSFADITEGEKAELVQWALKHVDDSAERDAQHAEASARVDAFTEEIYGEPFGDRSISRLTTNRVRLILLEALRGELAGKKIQFSEISKEERRKWARAVVEDVTERGNAVRDAILLEQARLGEPFPLTYEKMLESTLRALQQGMGEVGRSFREFSSTEQTALIREAMAEVVARFAPLEKALEEGIATTSHPWNWQLTFEKKAMRELLMDALERELSMAKRTFVSLSRAERDAAAKRLVDAALGPYRVRPNLVAIGVGLGAPIGFAYAGGSLLPEQLRPAWYVLTTVVSYTFTFGVTYWVNAKLKPYFALNQKAPPPVARSPIAIEVERLVTGGRPVSGETPFFRDMVDIGTASTGIPDPMREGRNIVKDGELNPRDSMNDAAWRIRDEEDARATLAGAIVYQVTSFPEMKVESLLSFLLFMKLKERFANQEAFDRVRAYIVEQTAEKAVVQAEAVARLTRILRPDLWEAPKAKPYSVEADNEIRRLLRIHDGLEFESAAQQIAWAALFCELHYPGNQLSRATTFEVFMQLKGRFILDAVHAQAKAEVALEAPGLGLSIEKVQARLADLLRLDLWPR